MGSGSVPGAGETPDAPGRVPDLPWRELRIAPVMTGGTSLAIWMAGATAELYRATRALREPTNNDDGLAIYRSLLELTRTEATVDIITGTSAGGLNGVLLAAATALDTSIERFMKTRTTWQEAGDIEKLLDLCDNIFGRAFCALGDAATTPITSAIHYFRDEFEAAMHTPAWELFPYQKNTNFADDLAVAGGAGTGGRP